MKLETKVNFLEEYTDKVTGFKGKVTGVFFYTAGCIRVQLEASDKENNPVEYIFDEDRLVPVKTQKVTQKKTAVRTSRNISAKTRSR